MVLQSALATLPTPPETPTSLCGPGATATTSDELVPRPYQDQLLDVSLAGNTIIYLPTGAGKTFIALQAIKRMSAPLTLSLAEGGKRSVFLVNTVVLANQQTDATVKATALKCAKFTGDMNVDAWRRDRWLEEFEENQVLIATCQIILDVLRAGYVRLEHINLIIFDECHHAVTDHPMHQLMRIYSEHPATQRPRIIGLTGMLISQSVRPDTVVEQLYRLECTFLARIATVRSYQEMNNVLVYSTKPKESIMRFQSGSGVDADVTARVVAAIAELVKLVELWPAKGRAFLPGVSAGSSKQQLHGQQLTSTPMWARKLLQDFLFQLDVLGLYGASIAILSLIVEVELKKRSAETSQTRQLLRLVACGAERIRHIICTELYDTADEDDDAEDEATTILTNSSPKVVNFLLHMRKFYESYAQPDDLKALVFAQRRHTAKCVFVVLQRYAASCARRAPHSRFGQLRADFMVGNNSQMPESVETILENKWNRRVVERFRRNELNVIVASSVLEEGIDLQECNLVMALDTPLSFRSYVQSKGRARMQNSSYVMFVALSDYSRFVGELAKWRQVEVVLREYLITRTVDAKPPLAEDVQRELFGEAPAPVYRTALGARLEETSATSLLNRYCMSLPNDTFTSAAVNWSKCEVRGGAGGAHAMGAPSQPVRIVVSIQLPMQSTVKELIVGEPRATLKLAKRSAAFVACRRLHEAGELNDNLMAISSRRVLQMVSNNYFGHWQQYENETSRDAGTRKNLRIHPIWRPLALIQCNPLIASCSWLYTIRMVPAFARPAANDPRPDHDPTLAAVHDLLQHSERRWGILTARQLPAVGAFKLFHHFGGIAVHLDRQPQRIRHADLNGLALRESHNCLFTGILRTVRPFLMLDTLAAAYDTVLDNDYLVVPCNATGIDASAVDAICRPAPDEPSAEQRRQQHFAAAQYEGAVVRPWYRRNVQQAYIVTRVCRQMSPFASHLSLCSPVDGRQLSFAEYVHEKYGEEAVNRATDFMLEVRPISQQLNRLQPGAEQDGSASKGRRGAATARRLEYLIPEMCTLLAVPADLWLQATLVPSSLHRLEFVLQAEELRAELNAAIGMSEAESARCEPPALLEKRVVVESPRKAAAAPVPTDNPVVSDPWSEFIDETPPVPICAPAATEAASSAQPDPVADPWGLIDLDDAFAELDIVIPPPPTTGVTATTDRQQRETLASIACPWAEYEEPTDARRSICDIYPIDLQYYDRFVESTDTAANQPLLAAYVGHVKDTLREPCTTPPPVQCIRMLEISADDAAQGVRQCDLLAALTANRSGDCFDGERLEVLGDAFLKFAASVFLLREHPTWHEGHLTSCKGQLVSNRNLFYLAEQRRLGGRLKVHAFEPRDSWRPPAFRVPPALAVAMREAAVPAHLLAGFALTEEERASGVVAADRVAEFVQPLRGTDNAEADARTQAARTLNPIALPQNVFLGQQLVADKVVADAVEACLGATLSAVGVERTLRSLGYWGILPERKGRDYAQLLREPFTQPRLRRDSAQSDIDQLLPNYALLEQQLGYQFRDRAYLLQALTHPSFPTNSVTGCYQQLEFLGDAVLDVLVTAHIYERCPDLQPGRLTDLRSALVNNITLACLCVRHHFQRFILAQNAVLAEQTGEFVRFQVAHGHRVTEQVLMLVAEGDTRMAEFVDVPKTLGDVVEALVGAVFLDSGNDLRRTWEVVWRLLHAEVEAFAADTPVQVVRRLGEWVSAKATYDVPFVDEEVVMVVCRYTCRNQLRQARGFGRNAQMAKNAAAKLALSDLLGADK